MKNIKQLTAKVLEVTARDFGWDSPSEDHTFTFKALEFHNGLILISSEITNDWFFECREEIEACVACSEILSVQETGGGTHVE